MEAFSLLKYWRNGVVGNGNGNGNGGGGRGGGTTAIDSNAGTRTTTTTIATSVKETVVEDDGDEGPFFDLEFQVPEEEEGENNEQNNNGSSKELEEEEDDDDDESLVGSATDDGEPEFNFAVSPNSSGGRTDPNITFSPSDDLFFKGRLVPLEESSSSSLLFSTQSADSTKLPPQFPVSLMKTATKFRVFMLGFKKQKPVLPSTDHAINEGTTTTHHQEASKQQQPKQEKSQTQTQTEEQQQQQPQTQQTQNQQKLSSKFFEVKFKIEEVPIISLFTRDNSSKNPVNKNNNKQQQQQSFSTEEVINVNAEAEEKKFSKDVVQKYLKMIKPLYVKASKRYGSEKMRFSGQLSLNSGNKTGPASMSTMPPVQSTAKKIDGVAEESDQGKTVVTDDVVVKSQMKQGSNLPAGLRVVRQHFAKSRSASSAVTPSGGGGVQAKRRDDSLLQQQDGIQSAILHCKRSFNASRDSDSFSLSRSTSHSSRKKSIDAASRTSFDEVIESRC